ncbi:hypothetical protein EJB05_04338 [Eragrostis curvula]|uniref:No apical meristem-associated C-terminal domain-containing protein n=1 Tax=Eragrostis curvula TaxID=38414 RepID=A0A5J9WA50_9POAL|nr:hypothetical protein EJB05_04338 [Eragrostis curvula]
MTTGSRKSSRTRRGRGERLRRAGLAAAGRTCTRWAARGARTGGRRGEHRRRATQPEETPAANIQSIPICGGQGSQNPSYYAPDQWAYQLESSMDPLEHPESEQVNYVIDAQTYREDVEVVAPPTTRKGRKKIVSRRGGGFTKEEDGVICSAFLNVSKKPITGADKRRGGYYKRLHDYYNTFKPEGSNRSQLAVQNRWGTIQRSVRKFCEFKSAVDRLNESGKNEQDRIDDAIKMYEAVEPFHFMHCWKILRNESKWNDMVLELSSNSAGTGREGSSLANSGPAAVPEGGCAPVTEQNPPYYAPDQWPYQLESSMDPLEHPQSEQVNVIDAQIYHEEVEVVAPPTTRKGREKNVSRRGGGFTKEEDGVICTAFLYVSKNPITGANKRQGGYYKRLHDYYKTFKPEGSNRSQLAVQHRWGTIQRSVRKFCGFKSAVDRLNESGKNEQDRIDDAIKMYEAVEPFHFMHCWKILRNESKWNDMVLELSSNSAGTGREGSSQANSGPAAVPEGGNENSMLPRPEGRDSATRKRVADASSSSTGVHIHRATQPQETPAAVSVNCKLAFKNRQSIPICGGQGSQNPSYYAPDQWAYQLESSMDPLEHPESEQVNYVIDAQTYREDVEVVAPPTTRKGREKNVSRRGGGFTKEEDGAICSAFLNVSKNPITGANQRQGGYYKRLHDYYNTLKPEGSNRSQLAVQYRWGTIQRSVRKFCEFKSSVDRLNESGKNEQDRIDDAIKMYEAVEPFHFMHCWKILRNESKWNGKDLELNRNSAGTGREGSSQANSGPAAVPEGGNENSMLPRPEGRDSAKKKRIADASSSSTAVDVLQRINENREKCQQKEDEQMVQILTRKDEKLSLQREVLELKKQQLEENLILRKQEAENAAKQAEAQLLLAEAQIMSVDIDKVAPRLKNYYIGMQLQIAERRGFASSEPKDA